MISLRSDFVTDEDLRLTTERLPVLEFRASFCERAKTGDLGLPAHELQGD
jgi:hypothetical protein